MLGGIMRLEKTDQKGQAVFWFGLLIFLLTNGHCITV